MAKQRRGEKTAAVSEYLDVHSGAGPKEIVAALAKQHITITTAHVSAIKSKLNKGRTGKKTAEKPAVIEAVGTGGRRKARDRMAVRSRWSRSKRSPRRSRRWAATSV